MNRWRGFVMTSVNLVKWSTLTLAVPVIIGCTIGMLTGTSSAALLNALEWATGWRESHGWILLLLPVGGLLSGLIYHYLGRSIEAGNNLILAEIHNPQAVIPLRMAPLVLIGTTLAHLFGASVGREGTAVQMGAALADSLLQGLLCLRIAKGEAISTPLSTTPLSTSPPTVRVRLLLAQFGLHGIERRFILMAGISGGFASVFGTPLAGMLFGLEVLAFGKFCFEGLLICAIAAIVGDRITLAWGLHHQIYQIPIVPQLTIWGLFIAIFAGVIFGLTARLFATLTHQIGAYFNAKISYPPLRPFVGGVLVAIAIQLLGTTKYIGLGMPTISSAFTTQLLPWDFAAKIAFTALSLGSAFKGGEVTPLFYIGATLGNAIAPLTGLPTPLLAGMGFVGVFAGAANTPLTSTMMAIELFGVPTGIYAGIACICSYLCSGHTGIYHAQRVGSSKYTALKHHEEQSIGAVGIDRLSIDPHKSRLFK